MMIDPFTDEELAEIRAAPVRWPCGWTDLRRFLATIDRDRAESDEAKAALAKWGKRANEANRNLALANVEIKALQAQLEEAQLRSIEARNPGIDMDEVRHIRREGAEIKYLRAQCTADQAEIKTLRAIVRKAVDANPPSSVETGPLCWWVTRLASDGQRSIEMIALNDAEADALHRALETDT